MPSFPIGSNLDALSQALLDSYREVPPISRIGQPALPSQAEVVEAAKLLIELTFPGFHGRQDLSSEDLRYHVGELISLATNRLHPQIAAAIRYARQRLQTAASTNDATCMEQANRVMVEFFRQIPAIREMLAGDVQAAFEGDPAAKTTDEIVLAYPGIYAISIYRLAHALHKLDVPLIPRMMTEHAHSRTGIDIHPGATIGREFFIDHGTGVVIGETAIIGDRVRLYQGVTLGGLRPEKGQEIAGTKRHPTIGNDVVIFANAIILGGDTVIGDGCTIGGSVFLTSSVPANTFVVIKPPELTLKRRREKKPGERVLEAVTPLDFQI